MKSNLAIAITGAMMITPHVNHLRDTSALISNSGQPTINGGRKTFKQNKRKQSKRNR